MINGNFVAVAGGLLLAMAVVLRMESAPRSWSAMSIPDHHKYLRCIVTTATPTLAVHTAARDRLRRRFGVRRVLTGTLIALTALVAAAAAVMLQIAFLPVLSPSMSRCSRRVTWPSPERWR